MDIRLLCFKNIQVSIIFLGLRPALVAEIHACLGFAVKLLRVSSQIHVIEMTVGWQPREGEGPPYETKVS